MLNPTQMKIRTIHTVLPILPLLLFLHSGFGQAPNLRTAGNFVFFTTTGAVSNAGISLVTGNVGTNAGALTGFGGLIGLTDSVNAVSAQAAVDLLIAYTQLSLAIPTSFPAVLLGNGQVLHPGVYLIGAATTLNLGLTLDAQGNPNAVFIIQITGAFSTTAGSSVTLINGASACNVFWKVEGAFSMAVGSTMRGTVVVNNGAISMTPGDVLEGRALSTTGAIAVNGVVATDVCAAFITLPVDLMSFTGACEQQKVVLQWSTATGTNIDYFTVERSVDGVKWLAVGTVQAGSSSPQPEYSFADSSINQRVSYYRLRQAYIGGLNAYGPVISVQGCGADDEENILLYPNPSPGKFMVTFAGDKSQVYATEVFNAQGGKVYESRGFQSTLDLSKAPSGIYFVQIRLSTRNIVKKVAVEKGW
jgi:hypothetical protein